MTNSLRDKDPAAFRLITIRTAESRLWLLPTPKIAKLIGGIVARYQEIFGIEIFAFAVLSNHYHMVIRAPASNTDEFCENINREISRRINWRFRREGKLWGRRYTDQRILSSDDLLECLLYVTTNAVRHGLVQHPREWLGLSCYEPMMSDRSPRYSFHHHSARGDKPFITQHTLRLSRLPGYEALSSREWRLFLNNLIEDRVSSLVEARMRSGKGFLGVEALREQVAGEKPQNSSKSARGACYSKRRELIRAYRVSRFELRRRYDLASRRYRLGHESEFPAFTFRPPLHRRPRSRPFQLLEITELASAV